MRPSSEVDSLPLSCHCRGEKTEAWLNYYSLLSERGPTDVRLGGKAGEIPLLFAKRVTKILCYMHIITINIYFVAEGVSGREGILPWKSMSSDQPLQESERERKRERQTPL